MKQRYMVAAAIILSSIIVSLVLVHLGMPPEIVGATIGGIYTFASVELYSAHKEQEKPKEQIINDIKKRKYRHPFLVFLSGLAIMQVTWNVVSFFLGAVVGLTLGPAAEDYTQRYTAAAGIVAAVIMAFLVAPIAVYVAHRIKRRAFLWTCGLIVVNQILLVAQSIVIVKSMQLAHIEQAVIGSLVFITLLLPGAAIGYFAAKKTQQTFVMTQLFKRLTVHDKKALVELVDSLPSASSAPTK